MYVKFWPKVYLNLYPFLGNLTTHATIVPLTKLDGVYRDLISPDNLNPKLIPLARYYTVSEMIFFYFLLWVSRSHLLMQITSHSAYVATNTESNGAKIDGF